MLRCATALLSALVLALGACTGGSTFIFVGDLGAADTGASDARHEGVSDSKSLYDAGVKTRDTLPGCKPQNFTLKQAPPAEVYLVLDRSGSMSEKAPSATVTKWKELYDATDFVLQKYETSIRFGLLMYPSDKLCKTPGPQVKVDKHNRAAVLSFLGKATPAGGTPTAAALNNAAASLTSLGNKLAKKYIILATDGGPNSTICSPSLPSAAAPTQPRRTTVAPATPRLAAIPGTHASTINAALA